MNRKQRAKRAHQPRRGVPAPAAGLMNFATGQEVEMLPAVLTGPDRVYLTDNSGRPFTLAEATYYARLLADVSRMYALALPEAVRADLYAQLEQFYVDRMAELMDPDRGAA